MPLTQTSRGQCHHVLSPHLIGYESHRPTTTQTSVRKGTFGALVRWLEDFLAICRCVAAGPGGIQRREIMSKMTLFFAGKAPPPSWKCGVDYVSLPQNSFELGEVCVVSRSDGRHSLAVVVRDRGESRSGRALPSQSKSVWICFLSYAHLPTNLLARRKRGRVGRPSWDTVVRRGFLTITMPFPHLVVSQVRRPSREWAR